MSPSRLGMPLRGSHDFGPRNNALYDEAVSDLSVSYGQLAIKHAISLPRAIEIIKRLRDQIHFNNKNNTVRKAKSNEK